MATKTIKAARRSIFGNSSHTTEAQNWALIRHSNNANPFTKKYGTSDTNEYDNYTFTYDDNHGEGQDVDIVFNVSSMPDISNDGYKTNGVSRIVQFDWSTVQSGITREIVPLNIYLIGVNSAQPYLSIFLDGISDPSQSFSVGDTFTITGAPTSEVTLGNDIFLPSGAPDINNRTFTISEFSGSFMRANVDFLTTEQTELRSFFNGNFSANFYYLAQTYINAYTNFDYKVTGLPVDINVNYSVGSSNTHAEQVISCAVHNDFGAATKSNIYILPRNQIEQDEQVIWKLIKNFHESKTNGNPTICISSFGGRNFNARISSVNFRGNIYSTTNDGNGVLENTGGVFMYENGFGIAYQNRTPYSLAEQAALTEMTDAGVIHVSSAGNQNHKVDHANGVDYNNSITVITRGTGSPLKDPFSTERFYCRTSWTNPDTIQVGNLDSDFGGANFDSTVPPAKKDPFEGEFIAPSSNRGPAVDCYVGGTELNIPIMSSGSPIITTTSGTSFSCPTLGGMIAAVASKYPSTTPAQMKKYIREIAVSDAPIMNRDFRPSKSNGDFGDPNHLNTSTQCGGNAKITYIDPSLPYDPSTITDTTINYKDDTLRGVYNY